MDNRVCEFPKKLKKDELHLLVPESDFDKLMQGMVKHCFRSGLNQGVLIGISLTNLLWLISNYFFK